MDQLQTRALQKVVEVSDAASAENSSAYPLVWSHVADQLGQGPVMDGKLLPGSIPLIPPRPAISAARGSIAVSGTTSPSVTTTLNHPEDEGDERGECEKRLGNMYGNDPERIIPAVQYSALRTRRRSSSTFSLAAEAEQVRQGAVIQGTCKNGGGNAGLSLLVLPGRRRLPDTARPRPSTR